jgi:hypothetical protein
VVVQGFDDCILVRQRRMHTLLSPADCIGAAGRHNG